MTWEGLNRRQFPRVIYPCLIKISCPGQKTENLLTHTENIGLGGVCVIIKKEIKIFTDVEVEIDLLDAFDHISTRGKVVWVVRRTSIEALKPMFYDTGIEFVNLAGQHKEHLQETINRVVKNGAEVLRAIY
ncbi:MAG: PilZ domain-containing protein [Candidatus Omnitrophica bacterium]|nr:PilZ domain-containing protein [Candidatus Omnitrophota bacterium]